MFRFLLGVAVVIWVTTYSDEIKSYTVEIGLRDLTVAYLRTW